jgi:hypothetical protein
MLTPWEFDRQLEQRALALKAQAAASEPAGESWLASRFFDGDPVPGGTEGMVRREVSRGPAERDGTGPGPGSPSEILRGLQEQQVAGVITARMPGPGDWAYLERPLPGPPPAHTVPVVGEAHKADQALTPQHAAAEAAMDGCDDDEDQAEEVRRRVRHLADPGQPGVPEVAEADLGKRFSQAFDVPSGYPAPGRMDPEAFRRGAIVAGEAAYSVGYATPARPVPVPSETLSAAAITRPQLTEGHSWPGPQSGS